MRACGRGAGSPSRWRRPRRAGSARAPAARGVARSPAGPSRWAGRLSPPAGRPSTLRPAAGAAPATLDRTVLRGRRIEAPLARHTGLRYTRTVATDPATAFDAMAASYDELEPWYEHLYAVLHGLVRRELAPPAGGRRLRALDAGCGTGFQTAILAELGYETLGVDLSAGLLRAALPRCGRARLAQADVEALPCRDGTLDLVVSCGSTLSFVPRPDRAVSEIARVLRPGGRALPRGRASLEPRPGVAARLQRGGRSARLRRDGTRGGPGVRPAARRRRLDRLPGLSAPEALHAVRARPAARRCRPRPGPRVGTPFRDQSPAVHGLAPPAPRADPRRALPRALHARSGPRRDRPGPGPGQQPGDPGGEVGGVQSWPPRHRSVAKAPMLRPAYRFPPATAEVASTDGARAMASSSGTQRAGASRPAAAATAGAARRRGVRTRGSAGPRPRPRRSRAPAGAALAACRRAAAAARP